jgi:Kef-type K+ transport system membrane component KefB
MEPNPLLFRDLTYIFLAAVFGGLVAWRLRLPLILGFILGGIVVSPYTPGPHLSELHTFEVFAEVGVVLLMFSIGVEFSIPDLMRVKWVALVGAPIGILFIVGVAIAAAEFVGWGFREGIVIGATVSVASTMVLARLLSDTGRLATTYGRVMIGITLVEDLAVICMTVVLPVFGSSGDGRFVKAAWLLGKALILLIPLVFLAIKVIPGLFRRAKMTKDPELFLLVAIAVCLGTAALAQTVGFSVALGAFLAGLSISGSRDLHDAHAQLVPLRDAFVALFLRVTLASHGLSGFTAAPLVRLDRDSDDCYGCGDVFLRAMECAQGHPRRSGETRAGHSADRRGLFHLQVGGPHSVYGERFQGGSVQSRWTGGPAQRQDRHLRQGCRAASTGLPGMTSSTIPCRAM